MASKTVNYKTGSKTYEERAKETIAIARTNRPYFPYKPTNSSSFSDGNVDYYTIEAGSYGVMDTSTCWFFYNSVYMYGDNWVSTQNLFMPIFQDDTYRPFIVIHTESGSSYGLWAYCFACAEDKVNDWSNSPSYKAMGAGNYNYASNVLALTFSGSGYNPYSATNFQFTKDNIFNTNTTRKYGSDVRCHMYTFSNWIFDGYDSTTYRTRGLSHYTNMPIFEYNDVDSVRNWILNGDRSGELIFNDFSQDYTLYIDGDNRPNYKLTWNSELDSDTAERSQIELLVGYEVGYDINYLTYKTVNYLDGNVSFIWQDLEDLLYDKLLGYNEIHFAVRFVSGNYLGTRCGVTLLRKKGIFSSDLWKDIIYEEVVDFSSLSVEAGTGEGDDGYVPPDNTDDGNDETGDGSYSTSGALTKTYSMSLSRLRSFGAFLWSSSFIDDVHLINSSPIENVVSVKAFPFSLDGVDESIKLGNVETGINGELLSSNVVTLNKGSILIDGKYNSFLDFAPYTKVALHLPYIGFVELDTNMIMGKTISVRYIVDLVEGGCLAQVLLGSRVINEYKGDMGIDVPITSSNRAQVQAAHVAGAIGAATGLITADIGASVKNAMSTAYGISNAASSVLDSAVTPYHYTTQGGGSPAVSSGEGANRNIYVIIDRPMYQELSAFNHTKGRLCNLSKRIGSLKGFTSTTPMIDLNGIPCTGGEKEEIRRILSQGFFA